MNGDVTYDLVGGNVSFDVLYRLDQLAAALTGLYGTPGWRVQVQVDPGIVLTATPAREFDDPTQATPAPVRPSEAPLTPEDGEDG